ncbi:hypothetical protein [Paenibacillus pinihumi]|uniref:hypothetical protein n=1 Tax=Paenibacillus pinihumi TaxID=669462 RepID=UPI0003FA4CB9|nr:hypothetical protein [Paenibacillus pinihumi]
MAKTELTLQLERQIFGETSKLGVFGCFEVTIGWYGKERVDYMTYDTKGTWRCYEIKVSKADFRSKAHNTFIGHYNYYVMPRELYEEVQQEIPSHIGVYCGATLVKRPKRQQLGEDEQVLKDSMIRSLSRDVSKLLKSADPDYVNRANRTLERERREKHNYRQKYYDAMGEIRALKRMGDKEAL